jgi:hypothetical protein
MLCEDLFLRGEHDNPIYILYYIYIANNHHDIIRELD